MTDKASKSEIIAARKSGKQIRDIATEFGIDKMDVRDICKSVKRGPAQYKVQEKTEETE